ncbi:MAG: HAMP domain-containing sensor histidine kinase [Elusimicrobia bacterium]|nr:HAMP domain-containing sensor histidine kinase [Elusimicrobiota bacterium]
MKINRFREIAINISLVFSALVFLVILGTADLILKDARNSVFKDMRLRSEIFSRRAGTAMFPKEDLFSLHFLVNTMMLDKVIKYALVSDSAGRVRSHSDPDKIGSIDASREGDAARNSKIPLTQNFKGDDGLNYFYFSEPILVGNRRLGTVAVAINSETMKYRLADTTRDLLLIFLAALGAMGLLFEIRSLVRKEQKAAALKSAMVHTVSHEFNNALTVIDAVIYLLEESEPEKSDASRAGLYRTLGYQRNSLKLYVKNILNEARMEAGRFKIEKKPLALRDLVASLVSAMEELMRRKKISFSLDMPEGPGVVDADHEALALVISNLMGNAVKYTPESGRIAVRLAPDAQKAGHINFCIENSGRGIAAADIEKIKTEFFRTGEGQAAAEGFGLGLKICNDMLLLHGSSLEVTSEPGKNACFCFSLPVAAENIK